MVFCINHLVKTFVGYFRDLKWSCRVITADQQLGVDLIRRLKLA